MVLKLHSTPPLDVVDEKVLAMHMASIGISTTLLTPLFAMEHDDWTRTIGPDTFEDFPEVVKEVGVEGEDVGEGEADVATESKPQDSSIADDIWPGEPSILDVLPIDLTDPSSP